MHSTTIIDDVYQFTDTCNVYVIRNGREAVLIDFGSGDVLNELAALEIDRVTDVLITHYHRDQAQGLQKALADGIRVWVPYNEQDLFKEAEVHWQARQLYNNYDMRQDRFALLEPAAITGTLRDYECVH